MTPAMAAGVENRLWSIEELVERTSRKPQMNYIVKYYLGGRGPMPDETFATEDIVLNTC